MEKGGGGSSSKKDLKNQFYFFIIVHTHKLNFGEEGMHRVMGLSWTIVVAVAVLLLDRAPHVPGIAVDRLRWVIRNQ